MGDIKYTSEYGIKYERLIKPQISTGFPFSIEPYELEGDTLKKYPKPLINATDINWGGVNIGADNIDTTDELINFLNINSQNLDGISVSLISMMLSSIRALQSEVAKLRNSFRFGINSYTGEDFGMSQTVAELQDTNEVEPLWATDENELSFVEGLDLSQEGYQYITPTENFNIIINNKLSYRDNIVFTIPDGSNGKTLLEEITDPKQYIYITCSSRDIDVILTSSQKILTIKIKDIIKYNYNPEKYNILIVVSKKVENKKSDDTIELLGNNFIWLSVSEWGTGTDLFNGYISENGEFDYITSETPVYNENIYNISEIHFNTLSEQYLYKLDVYTKYQDVSNTIEAATPTNVEDYKYRTASITIRSMSTYDKITQHVNELQNNELIYCEANKKLYIYTNGNIINIGSGGSSTEPTQDIMENYQILKALEEQGIITINYVDSMKTPESLKYDDGNIESFVLSNKFDITSNLDHIEKINFINGDTDKSFDITMSPYGTFDIKEKHVSIIAEKNGSKIVYRTISSMEEYLQKLDGSGSWIDNLPDDYHSDRGFVSLLKGYKKGLSFTGDMGLNGDHIEIGAIYSPLNTDQIHGCTHGYIELFNASDEDFYLDGCYLHYSYAENAAENTKENVIYRKLALDGFIPAGGTYLIRCKKYAEPDDPNVFINVKTYDKEWYITKDELLDLSMNKNGALSLALTYDDKLRDGTPIDQATNFTKAVPSDTSGYILSGGDTPLVIISTLIDSKCIGEDWGTGKDHWVPKDGNTYKARVFATKSNTIYKVTFALDPAKQAFQSMTTKDSSRRRWANSANDQQQLILNREFIEFPKTELVKSVSDYTPKASFEYKNVITDKSKLDKTKPNAVVCSFGINAYTTRCFNWVSSGLFDEAVVIIDPSNNKEYKFKSYTNITEDVTQSTAKIHRKEFPVDINNTVYARIYNKFPGNNEPYASHKCIVELPEATSTPVTYQYYICRLDSNGKIDNSYKSNNRSFTLYPKTYQPRVYQITDQQGFHWVEYQVWTAAAKEVNKKIIADQATENIMPVIINTGDCVQSGARVNEWLDYFNAGEYLFSHYEQNNIVGNNDLCDTDINKLGTGDDTGKSNGYFFHLFNCYEIPTDEYKPIVNNVYVPSLYYVDLDYINSSNVHKYTRILFINSEITYINCRDWFGIKDSNNNPINIYTGFNVNVEKLTTFTQTYYATSKNFKPIYEILWQWTNDNTKTYLPVCHEMPFTVVTNACLSWTNSNKQYSRFRSLSDAKDGKLIGSHTNQIADVESGKGMHWMSRLFEYRNITLCLGGHKHTYACTYPVRENYLYDSNKWSYKDGAMTMPATLKNDSAVWTVNVNVGGDKTINLSKFPIVKRQKKHKDQDTGATPYSFELYEKTMLIKISPDSEDTKKRFYPFVDADSNDNNTFVIYDMSQATGYKLTSNKELPSEYQKFSMVIPKTDTKISNGKFSDTASGDQQMPMFSIIDILGDNKYDVQVARVNNISSASGKMTFKQGNVGKTDAVIEYLCMAYGNNTTYLYGLWCKYENGKFYQTDVGTNKMTLNYVSGTQFNINNNKDYILYPSFITSNKIYLFKTYDMFNTESGDITE